MSAPVTAPAPEGAGPTLVAERRTRAWTHAVLAAAAFVPLLWTSPGKVSADTKSYLTLDPARLLGKAASLWDPAVGLGTVTHQTIGYLFPLGPYYWVMERLGVPDWLTQRLWLGLVFFAAGSGVARLLRWMGWHGASVLVAALAYQLSPYVLDYAARISVILLPWAALGWLVYLTGRSLRDGGWRWPAAFALTVLTVGGVNATALVLAGLAPLCWVVHDVAIVREVRLRAALAATGRIALLTVPVSAWWIAALAVQGRYGIPILRYTETYEAVARTSTAAEVLRGLGYWFFYGQDKVGSWVGPARPYTQSLVLVVLSFLPGALALCSLAAVRWRHRAYAVLVLVVGLTVAVGAHPYGAPAPYGALFKRLSTTTVGSALRSTPRAAPLVVLATAMALGAGAAALGDALARRMGPRPGWRLAPAVAACLLVAANLPSLWTGHLLTPSILRPSNVPSYWRDAAEAIDAGDRGTRVLETPGADFADYRWGGTVDPITPGLTDRAYVARELVPYGSAPGADLLNAYERRIADRVAEPAATAPILKMLSVGTLVARNDLQYERYRLARPRTMAEALAGSPGLVAGPTFGPPAPNTPIARLPLVDAEELTTPATVADPAPVATYAVAGARPIVSTAAVDSPTVVSSDGEGLLDLAAAGLLPTDAPVLSMGDLVTRPDGLVTTLGRTPDLIVSDTNRRQARRWGSVRENLGYTETAGEVPLRADVTDNRLDVFPGADDSSSTVTEQRGVTRVQATGYGNPITYTPEDRAASALDGDPTTAWRVGAFADVTGERIEVVPVAPVATDHLTLLQPINGARNRWITAVRISTGGRSLDVELDESSRAEPGQRIELTDLPPVSPTSPLVIQILRTNFTKLPGYRGISAVGFAEIGLGDVRVDEVLRMPTDVFDKLPQASADQHLVLVMTRDRASALEPNRDDPELSIKRTFTLPAERTFTVSATVRAAPRATDSALAAVLPVSGVTAVASARLSGGPATRGQSAIDGDPGTAWQTPIDEPLQQLTLTTPATTTVDHLDLVVRADGRHSVPTALSIAADGRSPVVVSVPPIADGAGRDATATVHLDLAPLSGRTFVVRITAVREVPSIDYFSELPVAQPVAVAELGLAGPAGELRGAVGPGAAGTSCRDDLLTIDGQPVPLRLVGDLSTLASGRPVAVTGCDPTLVLGPTPHVVRSAVGRDLGLDLDRIVFDAAPPPPSGGGGGTSGPAGDTAAQAMGFRPSSAGKPAQVPGPPAPIDPAADTAPVPAPEVTVVAAGRTSYRLSVAATRAPYWLLLGLSHNPGWHAEIAGRDQGPSVLVNGYANGWLVTPRTSGEATEIVLRWTPQRVVARAIVVSSVATGLCVLILVAGGVRRRRKVADATASSTASAARLTGVRHRVAPPPSGPVPVAPGPRVDEPPRRAVRTVSRRDVVVTTAATVLAFLVAGPWAALAVPLTATATTLLPRRAARALCLVPPAMLLLGVAYVVAKQVRYDLPTDLEWPRAFEPAHVLAWSAVVVTAVLVMLSPASSATADAAGAGDP